MRFTYLCNSALAEVMCRYDTERTKMRRGQVPGCYTGNEKILYFSVLLKVWVLLSTFLQTINNNSIIINNKCVSSSNLIIIKY